MDQTISLPVKIKHCIFIIWELCKEYLRGTQLQELHTQQAHFEG